MLLPRFVLSLFRLGAALGAALALVGCTNDALVDTPVVNRLAWFTYLDGTTLRENCAAGQPFQARLIYNADYQRQVRIYNVVGDGAGGAYLNTRVGEGGTIDISRFTLEDPTAPLGGWTKSLTRLAPGEFEALKRALRESGAYEAPPIGRRLHSSQYFWLSSLCDDGAFHFQAWRAGEQGFADLAFPELLFAHDLTQVAVRPPRAIGAEAQLRPGPERKKVLGGPEFTVEVGEDGLLGP